MVIDQVYQLVQYVSNKEQRGNIPPSQFNVLARSAQLEFVSKRVGNIKIINERGVPIFGYDSTWRINEDLRPFIYGPVTIPILPGGNFVYPYGYIWVDAVHKNDFAEIKRLTADQYPRVKHSHIYPPTEDYPIMVMRGQYGFIDPYSIGSFQMSYLKEPPDPIWGYVDINDVPVFDVGISVDFTAPSLSINELAMLVLQHVGINLDAAQVAQYAMQKENLGT